MHKVYYNTENSYNLKKSMIKSDTCIHHFENLVYIILKTLSTSFKKLGVHHPIKKTWCEQFKKKLGFI